MSLNPAEVVFRPYEENDIPFLMDSWGRSYFAGSLVNKTFSPEQFHFYHRPIRERFFQRGNATVIIACSPDDPWLIAGWIAVEKTDAGMILQYLYIRTVFKHEGLARELIKRALPQGAICFTHLTDVASRIIHKQRECKSWKYIPHVV